MVATLKYSICQFNKVFWVALGYTRDVAQRIKLTVVPTPVMAQNNAIAFQNDCPAGELPYLQVLVRSVLVLNLTI